MVGSHVVAELTDAGHEVVCLSTRPADGISRSIIGDTSRVRFAECDIREIDALLSIARGEAVDAIVHAAALTGEAKARARTVEMLEVNVQGTWNVLQAGRELEVRRVVNLGSPAEYGRRVDLSPIGEDEINIEGVYGESKYLGHLLGLRFADAFGLDFVTCRVNAVYGPGTRFDPHRGLVGGTMMALLCRASATGETVRITGGADFPRAWTDVRDIAAGIRLVLEKEHPAYPVYNLGSGKLVTLGEIVDAILRDNPDADIKIGADDVTDARTAESLRGPADITRAREDLGFAPRIGIDQGVRDFVRWWRERDASDASDEREAR
jgi:nucleoside-diphosphate-sugar epimerase